MISKQIIHDYISRIENEISDNNNTSNEKNGVQYCGMLYGIRIAEGKKQYPINDTCAEITDEFKKGLIKGLWRVLWCTQKKEQLVKKRYDDADEALIASFFESECIPNCIERLKNKLQSANIDKGDTMRTKEDILIEISKIKHSINRGCSTSETTYKVGMVDGLYYAIGGDDTDTQDEYTVKINIEYELDKAAYKQYVADMKEIEDKMKTPNCITEELCIPIQTIGDKDGHFIKVKYKDNKPTEQISVTLRDVCNWWIDTYDHGITISKYTKISQITELIKHIMEDRGW